MAHSKMGNVDRHCPGALLCKVTNQSAFRELFQANGRLGVGIGEGGEGLFVGEVEVA
jgi:hypothetical protein